jgi:hypothetical protein
VRKTVALLLVLVFLIASFAFLFYIKSSHQESSSSPASSTTPTPSTSSATPQQEDNSSSTSSSSPAPSQPESTPSTQDSSPTTSTNPTDIAVTFWNRVSDSNESLVIIDSPTNNAEYSTHSVTLTVHAAAPSWSYMIDLFLRADWLENGKRLFYHMDYWNRPGPFFITKGITVTTTLSDIPEGKHTITVTANGYTSIAGSSSVNFTIGR